MNEQLVRDVLAGILLLVGGLMSFAAGIGMLRFRDTLTRLHAATKPQILGMACILLGIVLENLSWSTIGVALLVLVFQFLTQPLTAHMVGRSAYRADEIDRDALYVDELAGDIDRYRAEFGAADGARAGDEDADDLLAAAPDAVTDDPVGADDPDDPARQESARDE